MERVAVCFVLLTVTLGIFRGLTVKLGMLVIIEVDHEILIFIFTDSQLQTVKHIIL